MCLAELEKHEKIGEFPLVVMDNLREKFPEKFNPDGSMNWSWFEKEIRPKNFVYLRKDKNSLSFTFQNGPIKECGINGCQVDTLIEAASLIIQLFDNAIPHKENRRAIAHLDMALEALDRRKADREDRKVEGTSQK